MAIRISLIFGIPGMKKVISNIPRSLYPVHRTLQSRNSYTYATRRHAEEQQKTADTVHMV